MSPVARFKFTPFQIIASATLLLLSLVIIASLYRIIVLTGFSVIFVIIAGGCLVFLVAFCLKEASKKMLVEQKIVDEKRTQLEYGQWAKKQYRRMNVFLISGLSASLGLLALGILFILKNTLKQELEGVHIVLALFGLCIVTLAAHFVWLFIGELRFSFKSKKDIIAKIFEQTQR